MFTSSIIPVSHKDVIHDVAYHWYGKRIAFSSDKWVKIYGLGEDRQWRSTSSWEAHSGSVWRVKWAHPQFGETLATCSSDRTVAVWEEIYPPHKGDTMVNAPEWVKKTSLAESNGPVTDVKFAPHHLGLRLAACSADGYVRIYVCLDVMDKSRWLLQQELYWKPACSSLSWSYCRNQLPMIAVASDDHAAASGSKVLLLVYSEKEYSWKKLIELDITDPVNDLAFAPCIERSYHHLAIASESLLVLSITPVQCSKNPKESPPQPVDCNRSPEESIPQPVDCNKNPEESIPEPVDYSKCLESIPQPVDCNKNPEESIPEPVDCSKCLESTPQPVCRKCLKESIPQPGNCSNSPEESLPEIPDYEINLVVQLDHKPQVWRVSWNLTGTVLSSSGDDSTIRQWKCNPFGIWNCITVVKSDEAREPVDSLLETMARTMNR